MKREKRDRLFGTDGIRSRFGEFPLSEESIVKIAAVTETLFKPKKILVGMDTRYSGGLILDLLSKGFGRGIQIFDSGIITTPGVSYLTERGDFDMGIMLSASHNPWEYNGIKFFTSSGTKISVDDEKIFENIFFNHIETGDGHPEIIRYKENGRYGDFLKNIAGELSSRKYRLIIDCANGSASEIAPEVFKETGNSISITGNLPDGRNINRNCGSTFPGSMIEKVKSSSADLGIAFDGDADRVIISDKYGRIIDGDHILFTIARYFSDSIPEFPKKVIGTIMSNFSLEKSLKEAGISFERSDVGDRNVFNLMEKSGALLGGESSGHIISGRHCNSGDGILTSLLFLKAMDHLSLGPEDIYNFYQPFPQETVSIPISERRELGSWERLQKMIEDFNRHYGDNSRIVIRYSGTEPKIRIMIESENRETVKKNINKFREYIFTEIGGEL